MIILYFMHYIQSFIVYFVVIIYIFSLAVFLTDVVYLFDR